MKPSKDVAVLILAAGMGKRMKSDLPKVLHQVGGRPMILYVIDAVAPLRAARVIVVTGYQADRVEAVCAGTGVEFVRQAEQLGTGHAVMQAQPLLDAFPGTVLVLNGDVPGLRTATIRRFLDAHRDIGCAATVLTARLDDPAGYGRVVRDPAGKLAAIVEHKDAPEDVRAIREVNSGAFCFEASELFPALRRVRRGNAQNEYYLTDVIGLLRAEGRLVGAYCVDDPREVAGVNDLDDLDAIRRFVTDDAS